jgi:hypothetical protein
MSRIPRRQNEKVLRRVRRGFVNPAVILLYFRDGHVTDLQTLFKALGVEHGSTTEENVIRSSAGYIVENLISAGLLRADDPEAETSPFSTGVNLERARISVTELLSRVQAALDISLTFLASFDRHTSMPVEPIFGLPEGLVESLDVFVLMPFKDDMLPVYEDHIKPTCASLKLSVRRADDFFTADSVVGDIWKAIVNARLIVADCTDRNPNVFYEIGLAHTIGKPTILLTQKSEDVPFDLRHWRHIAYQLTPRGMKEFETKFKETVRNVLSS